MGVEKPGGLIVSTRSRDLIRYMFSASLRNLLLRTTRSARAICYVPIKKPNTVVFKLRDSGLLNHSRYKILSSSSIQAFTMPPISPTLPPNQLIEEYIKQSKVIIFSK